MTRRVALKGYMGQPFRAADRRTEVRRLQTRPATSLALALRAQHWTVTEDDEIPSLFAGATWRQRLRHFFEN